MPPEARIVPQLLQLVHRALDAGAGRVAVIGRAQNVEIVLPYPQVSGRHYRPDA